MALASGLSHLPVYPQAILGAVLHWTGGQPFLTQKLCRLIAQKGQDIPSAKVAAYVADIVNADVIDNWLQQDSPEHIKTIQDRILNSTQSQQLLNLYGGVLRQRSVPINSTPEQIELRLSGLVIEVDRHLQVANRIYAAIFTPEWIAQHSSPHQEPDFSSTPAISTVTLENDRILIQAKRLFYISLVLFTLSGFMLGTTLFLSSNRGNPSSIHR